MRYNVEHFVMDFILLHLRWFLESWIFRMKIDGWRERSVTRVVVDIVVLYPLSTSLSLSLTVSVSHSNTHTHRLWRVSVCQADSLLSLVALGHWALSLCMLLCVCVAGAPGRPAAATEMISTSVQHSA